ncbi:MAG: DUF4340 domain-containing protein [Terriglobales bacterium]
MNIRRLVVAAAVFFILAGVLYWSEHHQPSQEAGKVSPDTPPVILKLDESAITKLDLKRKDVDPVVLTKGDAGKWRIVEPKPFGADQNTVAAIVTAVSSLSAQRLVDDHTADLKQYGLDPPAFEMDVSERDNKTQKLLIGDDTTASGAVYVKLADDSRVFTMPKYVKTSLDKSLNDLRDKRLLTIDPEKVSRIELAHTTKNQDIEFGRNKEEWQITKPPMRADGVQVSELLRKLTDAKMDLSASDNIDAAKEFAKATPIAIVRVTDESGTQELQVRKAGKEKDKAAYYAKSSAVDGAYKIDSELGQSLDKSLDEFRNKKLFDFGYDEPNKIELHDGSKAYFLSRSGADWWANGKKMDAESVQGLISKLRDLSAEKFPDSGFTTSTITVFVTSNDGKRTENVLIAKSGDVYLAKRESEPALYQLTASAVDDLTKAAEAIKPAAAAPAK